MTERSLLYVPADQPSKLAQALTRGADGVIVDFEDSVASRNKDSARAAATTWLAAVEPGASTIWVRINSEPELREADVCAVAGIAQVTGLCVAKTHSASELAELDRMLTSLGSHVALAPLLETAAAILNAREIAAAPRVRRLQIGEADLCADLGVHPSEDRRELLWVRAQIVLASAAAGIDAPLAPVSTDFRNKDRLRTSTIGLWRMGFGGRACIHPRQVAVVNEVFTPSEQDLARARDLVESLDAAETGVALDRDGRVVDEAVVRLARRLLATHDRGQQRGPSD